ncbi:aconitase X swivel domain-containing protein [Thermodesulfobacteriota bacterium]
MGEIILRGHRVAKGRAEGEALVSNQPISFLGGVNPVTGLITDRNHDLYGLNVSDKILVFPVGKGSSVGSYRLCEMARCKTQPKGIINLRADPVIAVGAIISNIPMMHKTDGNPLELIKTGDYVELDADMGIIKVRPRN